MVHRIVLPLSLSLVIQFCSQVSGECYGSTFCFYEEQRIPLYLYAVSVQQQQKKERLEHICFIWKHRDEVLHVKEMIETLPREQGHQSHYTHTQTDATVRGSFYIHMYSSFTTIPMRSDGYALRLSGTNGMIRSLHVQASLLLHNHWDATWARMIRTTSDRLQKRLEKKTGSHCHGKCGMIDMARAACSRSAIMQPWKKFRGLFGCECVI